MTAKTKPANVSDASWETWLEVQANSDRLKACEGPHEFTPQSKELFSKYECAKCKGSIDGVQARWYQLGMEHGRKATT